MIKKTCENKKYNFCSRQHFSYLKGLAILCVLVGHIGNYSGRTWFTPLGGIGVAVFLFCSGYGLMTSFKKKGLYSFWKNKLISIYLPFAFVEIVATIILRRSVSDTILDLLFIKCMNPLGWYMQYLVVCYLIFWIGAKYIPNIKMRQLFWGIIAVTSFFVFSNLRAEQAVSFFSGLIVADYIHSEKVCNCSKFIGGYQALRKKHTIVCCMLLCTAIVLLAIKQLPVMRRQSHYIITMINLVMKVSCAAGCLLITKYIRPFQMLVSWLGQLSYALYLVHGYFMFFMEDNVLGKYAVNSLVMVMLSFASAVLLNEIIKNVYKWKV